MNKSEVCYVKIKGVYDPDDKYDVRNVALIGLNLERINFTNILTAIANMDFGRQPSLDKLGWLSSKEIYLLNLDKKLIFHMYDDRGLDIIAADKETLRPLYT